jgi:formate-dependent nitrite reductase membrane component NrfD
VSRAREAVVVPRAEPRSYYGRPVVKPPVWTPEVPWYFFTGGLTGAAATLALGAEWRGNERLAWSARVVAMIGGSVSPVLLIADLGRPARFLNMMRVFRPTSPMSVGSWLLALAGTSNGIAAAWKLLGLFERISLPARVTAGLTGPPMTTYTAALLANTAIPVWREARRELPFVFAGGAAASAGAAVAALTPVADAGPARRLTALGAGVEEIAAVMMEHRLGPLARPYHEGDALRYRRLARGLTAAGTLLVTLGGRRSRTAAVAGAGLAMAGSVARRWSVFKAGVASALDPSYTVGPQRARMERRDGTG